ncbi:porin family protein [Spongiibacter sp. KMU-166]|uniref:Porin family protein n=1 Tax=Spongiibacter thalassae TaxID=2721624 RepID=A0ABX1GD81_9GAMM|nr:porin family protein [Spongiibacter thalassae]NKI17132.1 porin family protein [Spongiibacter thalassae]
MDLISKDFKLLPTKTVLAGLGIVGAAAFYSSAVHAGPALSGPHMYVGGNYGVYKSRDGDFDEDDDFVELSLGAQFNQYFGVEAGYLNFGEFSGTAGSADIDGYDLAVVGRLPLTESFGLYAKAGQLFWDADFDFLGTKQSYDGDEPFVGVGVDFKVAENLAVNLEYDRYNIDLDDSSFPNPANNWEGDMDTMKIGARLMF